MLEKYLVCQQTVIDAKTYIEIVGEKPTYDAAAALYTTGQFVLHILEKQ